jgi:ribonuclease T2
MAFLLKVGAALAAVLPLTIAGTPETCTNTQLSCSGSSTNTCCFNTPGGLFQQVQFWDTDPATGPSTSWTIHGLWPNNCDGTYSEDCDKKRAYTNITQLLTAAGQTSTLDYMQTYWVSDDESNEAFWDHEWETHGTCISTLSPSCYTGYTPGDEAVDFFTKVVSLFKTLPTYTVSSPLHRSPEGL